MDRFDEKMLAGKSPLIREAEEFLREASLQDTENIVGTPKWEGEDGELKRIEKRKDLVKKAFALKEKILSSLEAEQASSEIQQLNEFIGKHNLRVFAFLELVDELEKNLREGSEEEKEKARKKLANSQYFMKNYQPTQEEPETSRARSELIEKLEKLKEL